MRFKKIFFIILFILIFPLTVSAEEKEPEDFYAEQYKISGADEINDSLPDSARNYFEQNGIDPSDYGWINTLSAENIFKHIWGFITGGAKAPLKTGAAILAIILISAALDSWDGKNGAANAAMTAASAAGAAVIAVPVFSVITASVNAVKGTGVFMLGFIPIFAVITAASGTAVTSVSMSALLLAAAEGVSYISGFVILPLMGGYMALSVSSSVSPLIKKSGIADGVKKLAFWIMSFVSTVFVGILGIQTAVNSAADTLTVKTAKFIIGSSVPVAGGVLSEAIGTVTASMGLLKSSIGIYGAVACCVILLPLVAELLLWRGMLMLTGCAAELFSLPQLSAMMKAIDSVMAILIGILLLTVAVFVISLTIVVTSGTVQ